MAASRKLQGDYFGDNIESREVQDPILLINFIQNYEFLYNMQHETFKNTCKRKAAWEEIASTLNMTSEDAQAGWKYLRDRYIRELKKARAGKANPDREWRFSSAMRWYDKFYTPRSSRFNLYQKSKYDHTDTSKDVSDTNSRPSSSLSNQGEKRINFRFHLMKSEESYDQANESNVSQNYVDQDEEDLNLNLNEDSSDLEVSGIKRQLEAPYNNDDRNNKKFAVAPVDTVLGDTCNSVVKTLSTMIPQTTNLRFGAYIGSRLDEMSTEKAQEMRKKLFDVLES